MHAEQREPQELPPLPLETVEEIDAAVFHFFQTIRNLQRLTRRQIAQLEALRKAPAPDENARAELEASLRSHQRTARRLMEHLGSMPRPSHV